MIIVTVYRNDTCITGYSLKGHAGFKPRGEDIVCAAVSVLAQTALLGLARYVKEGLTYSIDEDTGFLKCNLPQNLSELQMIQSQAILETMVTGLKNLQNSYSNYLKVFKRRWTSC